MSMNWTDQPVTILGLSKSGIAVAEYMANRGARCFLSETVPASPGNKENRDRLAALGVALEMGGHTAKCFDHSDWVIVSPGIPPSSQIMKELSLSGKTLISEVELAYRETDTPFVAITGTNGKTTTTTLVSRILESWGKKAPACGNIGTPIIGLADQGCDFLVAELSSFQLTLSPTIKAKVAMLLNFTPDHLDWHGSVEAYKRAKFELFLGPHTPEWSILNASDRVCHELAQLTDSQVFWFSRNPEDVAQFTHAIYRNEQGLLVLKTPELGEKILLDTAQLQLVGGHNHENVMAAAAACYLLGTPLETIAHSALTFEGVEHRLEPVASVGGVTYYNDSKATNPDATLSALAAFAPRKVVLIAGGRDKMGPLDDFVASVKSHATHVVLLGEASGRFSEVLKQAGYSHLSFAKDLDDAVSLAAQHGAADVPVLFSPACASFDMFKNFEERGRAFKQAVEHMLAVTSR